MSIGRVPGATGIQPSIVTAKGDLIVATASGSVTNQAVGSNNQVLTADSAQADGVKWANGSAATLTATGDLLYASAANTPARLAIGSTDQVLKVSGGIPAWGAAPSPSFVGCQAINDNFSVSYTQYTDLKIPFAGTDVFDTDAFHDSSTNNTRITIPTGKGGKYLFNVTAFLGGQNNYANLFFLKNNAVYKDYFGFQMYTSFTGTINGRFSGSVVVPMAAGDYAEVVYNSDKATGTITGCYATFSCVYLGA